MDDDDDLLFSSPSEVNGRRYSRGGASASKKAKTTKTVPLDVVASICHNVISDMESEFEGEAFKNALRQGHDAVAGQTIHILRSSFESNMKDESVSSLSSSAKSMSRKLEQKSSQLEEKSRQLEMKNRQLDTKDRLLKSAEHSLQSANSELDKIRAEIQGVDVATMKKELDGHKMMTSYVNLKQKLVDHIVISGSCAKSLEEVFRPYLYFDTKELQVNPCGAVEKIFPLLYPSEDDENLVPFNMSKMARLKNSMDRLQTLINELEKHMNNCETCKKSRLHATLVEMQKQESLCSICMEYKPETICVICEALHGCCEDCIDETLSYHHRTGRIDYKPQCGYCKTDYDPAKVRSSRATNKVRQMNLMLSQVEGH